MRTRPVRSESRPSGDGRRMRSRLLVVAALLSLVPVAQPASALPGPDPGDADPEFSVTLFPLNDDTEAFDVLDFARVDGWDFGDRESYRCAYVERFDAQGNLLFKIEIERSNEYRPGVVINDRGGMESGEGGAPSANGDVCGSPSGDGAWQPSGEDHFPHYLMDMTMENPTTLYVDGAPISSTLDLRREMCARAYWSAGDEPGEAVLWWDEDGPQHPQPDSPPLPCDGGNQEPSAVARMMVIPVAANAGVCAHDEIDGSRCRGMTQTPPPGGAHPSTVTLELRGHLRAYGFVGAPDGTGACAGARTVRVDRRAAGRWRTVRTELTTSSGFYSIRLPNRAGTYRARVVGTTLASGDVCQTAVSRKRVYRD